MEKRNRLTTWAAYALALVTIVTSTSAAESSGQDQQLEAAIAYLEQKLTESPILPLEGQDDFPLSEPGKDVD